VTWDETQKVASELLKLSTSYEARRFAQRKLSRKIKRILKGS